MINKDDDYWKDFDATWGIDNSQAKPKQVQTPITNWYKRLKSLMSIGKEKR